MIKLFWNTHNQNKPSSIDPTNKNAIGVSAMNKLTEELVEKATEEQWDGIPSGEMKKKTCEKACGSIQIHV